MQRLIHFENVLVIIFAAGLTMTILAQVVAYPGKAYQIAGTFMMFLAMLTWTISNTKEGGKKNADR